MNTNKLEKPFNQSGERGIAVLIALFALLLFSVVGLGMMYSTNMETAINSNYREKQNAMYAAMAGLQEARDRLRPYDITQPMPTGRLIAPAALPSLAAGNVLYIINPANGETVAPWWNSSSNPYYDTELCQEKILGLSGTVGVPCDTLPSGSSWYTVYDDSQSSANFWKFTNPLDFKWARISLKTNNMTAVSANADATDSRQVCWDGSRQLVLPAGYGPGCVRYGSVIAISVTNSGTGYTSTPTVTIDAPASGTQATATPNMVLTDGVVGAVNVTAEGANYMTVPTVTIDPPTLGSQATAHVCTSLAECPNPYIPPGASIASVSVSNGGTTCYANAPAVLFTGGGGSGAAATAPLTAGSTSCIVAWSVTGTCAAHKNETLTSVGLTGGGGAGFSGTLKFDSSGNIVTGYPTIENSGNGYTANPTGMSGFTGCGSLTLSVTRGRRVASPQTITPTSGGAGYTSAPAITFATGSGSADTLPVGSATLGPEPANSRKVLQIIVDNGGSGYTAIPAVTITGDGAGAAAAATLANSVYKVNSITITNEGIGYTTDPTVTISGGGGTGATATATLGRGANYGKIYMITALGQTKSGARSMMQMEATTALSGFHSTGALTIDGPNPSMQSMPNSMNFTVNGNDANSCGAPIPDPVKPAIGGYDDPSADPSTNSVEQIIDSLPDDRFDHYIGEGDYPSVKNVYESLGETLGTTLGLKSVLDGINQHKTNVGNTVSFGSAAVPAINYIEGDVTIDGGTDGYGVLAVTGRLQMNGNFTWHGPVLVIGDGILDFGGGGGGTIIGMVLVAKIYPDASHHTDADLLPTMGSPTINWNGGGGNSILYDHCWSTNMMSKVPINSPVSLRPLKVLSFRSLPY
jgi:hypothetical protein